jgi:hypothetical protein
MAELLKLDGVTAGYGASVVLEDISLALDDGDSPGAARPQWVANRRCSSR